MKKAWLIKVSIDNHTYNHGVMICDEKTVNVEVAGKGIPSIIDVSVENSNGDKIYTAGEEMIIRVSFDNPVNVGEIPELTLKFGEAYSVNKTEFIDVTDDNTCIRYKYVVAEGDNGVLTVKRLSGGLITDLTKKIEATTMLHASASGEDDENT